jgi:hypothetical protein
MLLGEALSPSAPAWAFFTAISLGIIGILAQQLKAFSDVKQLKAQSEAVRSEASKAHKSAAKAEENTKNVSNGFVDRMDSKLDILTGSQEALLSLVTSVDDRLSQHLHWHLEQEGKKNANSSESRPEV